MLAWPAFMAGDVVRFWRDFMTSAPDEVVRCEECRRILVRTPESGI